MSKYERKEKSARKHPHTLSSGASRTPLAPPLNRPGFKGPGFLRKATPISRPAHAAAAQSTVQEQLLPQELQQLLLNIFRDAFPASRDLEALKLLLREVRDGLVDGDLGRAFAREECLEAYAMRWSPSRMLGYANTLAWLFQDVGRDLAWVKAFVSGSRHYSKVVCFGGGAAEIMAFGAILRSVHPEVAGKPLSTVEEAGVSHRLGVTLIDAADWSKVISSLHTGLTSPPELSKYASASARASNFSLISPNTLIPNFTQADVLEALDVGHILGSAPTLVTFCFTLNDLYSTSIAKTTALLLKITKTASRDSLLLVIDSPGSCSETTIAQAEDSGEKKKKKHPMHWLMDYALIGQFQRQDADDDDEEVEKEVYWEKVCADESRWFRLLEGLKYPVSLENMRFQVHLFRRL